MYKIIAKIIVKRLKGYLHNIISLNQYAFIEKRQIVDNVVLAHEFIHLLKNKRRGKQKYIALKLDMAKAYDRVEWVYIQKLLVKIGFHETFINWIMQCITTPTYKFNINEDIVGEVKPTRGLRQGDQLSPYLFLLCAEGLFRILNQADKV